MVVSNFIVQDVLRRKLAMHNEQYHKLLHSIYNESMLFDASTSYDLHTASFKYTFFLSWKREKHSTRSTLLRARCMYNGRARAVFSKYKMSRFAFKK